tara:strand:+ start:1006 stop:1401 length:396 start_codon:yes stop_codon:yes gene_type:complete
MKEINHLSMRQLLAELDKLGVALKELTATKRAVMQRILFKRSVDGVPAKSDAHELVERTTTKHTVHKEHIAEFLEELRYTDAANVLNVIQVSIDERLYSELDKETQQKLAELVTERETTTRRVKAHEELNE